MCASCGNAYHIPADLISVSPSGDAPGDDEFPQSAATSSQTQPNDPNVNPVVGNTRWASGNITYSFMTLSVLYEIPYGPSNEPLTNFGALSSTQQSWARLALANYASVANVSFTELIGTQAPTATIRMAMSDAPSTAWAYLPSTSHLGGDVWFNKSSGQYNNPNYGNYAYGTFVHELGHAMGLTHPHENGMPSNVDSLEFTVMTYRSYIGASTSTGYTNETWGFPQTLMMYDIAALQYMYGANFSTNSGNTTYTWSPTTGQMFINGAGQTVPGGNVIFMTLWDGGGTDTYDFSNYTSGLSIDLRPGNWTTTTQDQKALLHFNGSQVARGNIANALQYNGDARSLIENAIGGAGNDTILGNSANNVLRGGRGNDTLNGLTGTDTAAFTGTFAQYGFAAISGGYQVIDSVAGRDGTDAVFEIENLQFSDGIYQVAQLQGNYTRPFVFPNLYGYSVAGVGDIDGDGHDDILLRGDQGTLVAWEMRNYQIDQAQVLNSNMTGWTLKAVGDFDADGDGDLLWKGVSNQYVTWGMQNGTISSGTVIHPNMTGWNFEGLGDFDDDGDSDILWRGDSSGDIVIWQIEDHSIAAGRVFAFGLHGWSTVSTGDIDADGDADVTLRGANSRALVEWFVEDGSVAAGKVLQDDMGASTVIGFGDFDGDHDDDLIVRQPNGTLMIWQIEDGTLVDTGQLSLDASISVVGVGDFNNDGKDDILVMNSSAELAIWRVDNDIFA